MDRINRIYRIFRIYRIRIKRYSSTISD